MDKPIGVKGDRRFMGLKIGKDLPFDGRLKKVLLDLASRTKGKMGTCGKVVHNPVHSLFKSCREVWGCRKKGGFQQVADKL